MAKFTLEQKMDAVLRYQSGVESVYTISESLNANPELVRMWIKQFEYHGIKAFEKSYTAYSMQFKLDVLNYMIENGTSSNETAVIFGISSSALIRKWRIQLSTEGTDALKPKKKGRPSMNKKRENKKAPAEGSMEALQAELERLRMENAYLKKLNALVQNKEKSPHKTKHK
jgi:transposase-like protein